METVQEWTEYEGRDMIQLPYDDAVGGGQNKAAFASKGANYLMRHDPSFQNLSSDMEEKKVWESGRLNKLAGHRKYSRSNVKVECLLGCRGRFSNVWKAQVGKTEVALKQISTKEVSLMDIWKERDLLIHLRHPRVCDIFGAFHDVDAFLVLELCYANLSSVITRLTEKDSLRFSVQLAQGLEWIHGKNVIHANLCPDNCLVTTSNNVVIADFGSAIILKRGYRSARAPHSLGSGGYQDYNANNDCIYSRASDMFSLGCIIFEMLTGKFLLKYEVRHVDNEEYGKAYIDGRVKNLGRKKITVHLEREKLELRVMAAGRFGEILKDLIQDGSNRMSAKGFLESEFVRNCMAEKNLTFDNLDKVPNRSDFVTTQYDINRFPKFRLYQQEASWIEDMFFTLMYYDEEDDPARFEQGCCAKYPNAMAVMELLAGKADGLPYGENTGVAGSRDNDHQGVSSVRTSDRSNNVAGPSSAVASGVQIIRAVSTQDSSSEATQGGTVSVGEQVNSLHHNDVAEHSSRMYCDTQSSTESPDLSPTSEEFYSFMNTLKLDLFSENVTKKTRNPREALKPPEHAADPTEVPRKRKNSAAKFANDEPKHPVGNVREHKKAEIPAVPPLPSKKKTSDKSNEESEAKPE